MEPVDETPGEQTGEAATLVAVPNVSISASDAMVDELAAAFQAGGRARLLAEPHFDPDHGRVVFTLAGFAGELAGALASGIGAATATVDLREHRGCHPCVGVVDVAPIVFLDRQARGAACAEALVLADMVGHGLSIPVFLYGVLAGGRLRSELRRGGAAGLAGRVAAGELHPDFGPHRVKPETGATLIAARPPLLAFNLELAPPATIDDARRVAAEIREGGSGGLEGVRAIGLELPSSGGVAQVSVNVEDHHAVSLGRLVAAVAERAEVATTELVGLAPRAAFDGFPAGLECRNRATLEDALGF